MSSVLKEPDNTRMNWSVTAMARFLARGLADLIGCANRFCSRMRRIVRSVRSQWRAAFLPMIEL
jgi:hypothetical protein